MALPKFTIYKHVKLEYGWRYCKAALHSNGKIKPDIVVVNGVEETHREGAYYLNHNQTWIPVGKDARDATKERLKRLNSAEYHRLNGIEATEARSRKLPVVPLQSAIDGYLAGIERAVASRNKRKGTLDLARTTLRKFTEHSKAQYLSDITVAHLDNYAAWCIETGRTHSAQTGRNEFLRVNQFLRAQGVVLTKTDGNRQIPIGMKDAPKVPETRNVITNTPEELEKFFAACRGFKQWVTFQTLQRAGLREMELATLRPEDIILNTAEPYIDVCKRTVDGYEFIPKWYQERHVNIDPDLADQLRKLKSTVRGALVFGTASNRLNLHLLRECNRIAVRAGLPQSRFKLHRFRANFATHCLRQGMDLETLREQMGHRDTESLRAYVNALKGEERAAKVAKVWSAIPLTKPQ